MDGICCNICSIFIYADARAERDLVCDVAIEEELEPAPQARSAVQNMAWWLVRVPKFEALPINVKCHLLVPVFAERTETLAAG